MVWFEESGGTEPLPKRLRGLEGLLNQCRGMTVLDLGGAEGHIAAEFVHRGAVCATVIDHMEPTRVAPCVTYIQADLNKRDELLGPFDIVLALSVAQKLENPVMFLRWAASMATQYLVVRTPGKQFHRKGRANGLPLDAGLILQGVATLVEEPTTFDGAWMGVFEVDT